MKKIIVVTGLTSLISFVQAGAQTTRKPESHMVVVKDVIQTTNYTYLQVKDRSMVRWLAVPLMEAKAGETYYYSSPMVMPDFESKELKRKFDTVFFLGGVSPVPIGTEKPHDVDEKNYKRTAPVMAREKINVEKADGGITVGELLAGKEKYAGKVVKIHAQVTKYNAQIMDKNWIHVQDGTQAGGKYDLMVTSGKETKVGDVILIEGTVAVNKDFGYGYNFDVMIENATFK